MSLQTVLLGLEEPQVAELVSFNTTVWTPANYVIDVDVDKIRQVGSYYLFPMQVEKGRATMAVINPEDVEFLVPSEFGVIEFDLYYFKSRYGQVLLRLVPCEYDSNEVKDFKIEGTKSLVKQYPNCAYAKYLNILEDSLEVINESSAIPFNGFGRTQDQWKEWTRAKRQEAEANGPEGA